MAVAVLIIPVTSANCCVFQENATVRGRDWYKPKTASHLLRVSAAQLPNQPLRVEALRLASFTIPASGPKC